MRILIATDAWAPQVNGVVRTLETMVAGLRSRGHMVKVISPDGRRCLPLPFYPEIPLTFITARGVGREIAEFAPDCIHIATEGPVGRAVRRWCLGKGAAFTTSFHTRFAEYMAMRLPLPGIERLAYGILRRFHAPSRQVLAPTPGAARDLAARGFANVTVWSRGVDPGFFDPPSEGECAEVAAFAAERPILIYLGRVAVEKGIEDFLAAELPGTKVVIGDGPARADLQRSFPGAKFLGYKFGEDLIRELAGGDVFVFPSRTDTFGLVMIEAMATGLPVAAYPVIGPTDVVEDGVSGALDDDLAQAIRRALTLSPSDAVNRARQFTWDRSVQQFEANLVPLSGVE